MKENISIIKGMDTLRTIAEERKVSVNVCLLYTSFVFRRQIM